MNWSKRKRFVVRSLSGYRSMSRGSVNRKPTRTWHVHDRAYNFKLISTHHTRRAARAKATELNRWHEDAVA